MALDTLEADLAGFFDVTAHIPSIMGVLAEKMDSSGIFM
jgi:hypothetical protein